MERFNVAIPVRAIGLGFYDKVRDVSDPDSLSQQFSVTNKTLIYSSHGDQKIAQLVTRWRK